MARAIHLTEEEQIHNGYVTKETLDAFTELAHGLQDTVEGLRYENYKLRKKLAEMRGSISSLYVESLPSDAEFFEEAQRKVLMDD